MSVKSNLQNAYAADLRKQILKLSGLFEQFASRRVVQPCHCFTLREISLDEISYACTSKDDGAVGTIESLPLDDFAVSLDRKHRQRGKNVMKQTKVLHKRSSEPEVFVILLEVEISVQATE